MFLPTDSKDKIGGNLAYPVGAELISEALHGISQAAQTSISFRSKTTIWVSQFNDILRNGTDYIIVECSMHHDWTNVPGVATSWHIVVYPVVRELKSVAKEALLAEGFPRLKNYLLETGPPEIQNWTPLFISFSPSEKRIY